MFQKFFQKYSKLKPSAFIIFNSLLAVAPLSYPSLHLMVDEKDQISDTMVNLLELTGIRIQDSSSQSTALSCNAALTLETRNLEDVTNAIQGKIDPAVTWRRKPNEERWEIKSSFSREQIGTIEKICKENFQQDKALYPKHKRYEGILFLGCSLNAARYRLSFLNHLIRQKKATFDDVYILTGPRDLDEKIGETDAGLLNKKNRMIVIHSSWKKPLKLPTTEPEMLSLIFDQSQHPLVKRKKAKMVVAEKKPGTKRADREDTVVGWLKLNPKAGRYLAIADQPYILQQQLSINKTLIKNNRMDIEVEVVGPRIRAKGPANSVDVQGNQAGILLDNMARIFYEVVEIKKLLKEAKT